jgi:signal transduction histidine kinase
VTVEDEGVGFDRSALDYSDADGLGLLSVRERLDLVGGRLDVTSTPGEGTRVTITVPVFSG